MNESACRAERESVLPNRSLRMPTMASRATRDAMRLAMMLPYRAMKARASIAPPNASSTGVLLTGELSESSNI